ncbi:HD domain-containing protein [Cohnella panacarvi]|uniref:HD domain-containing protein n=1 Tax=Cohnella panacarvi TaxID=400776 RepID=UPI00047D018D|nr:HD domain-containing protein [Cohnella panacarvi]
MYLHDRATAESWLEWAGKKNPGRWVDHSYNVAKAAEVIATAMQQSGEDIDPNIAYICGILHDIGRFRGVTPSVVHSYDGYQLMIEKGYPGNAQVCVTHSFPIQNRMIETSNGWDEVPNHVQKELISLIHQFDWNQYDFLLTLCDALSEADGFTLIERRLVSVAIRHGTNANVPMHWKGFFQIKNDIEQKIGQSIYRFFPETSDSIYSPIVIDN